MQLSRRRFLELLAAGGLGLAWPRRAAGLLCLEGEPSGGVSGAVERVVVVGAGMAGLAAASALRSAGVEVVVLEARTRLGGRTWTAQVGGVPIDLGAAWIHTPDGNPMSLLAAQVGATLLPADPVASLGKLSAFDARTGWLSVGELGIPLLQTTIFESELPALRAALGPDASVADAIGPFLDSRTLTPDERRRSAFGIRVLAEQFESAAAEDLSLAWYLNAGIEYAGVDSFPAGGYRRIVEWLARDLDVRLAEPALEVAYDAAGVVVTTEQGQHLGSHAIVTVPLGVLKAGALAFAPALPPAKLAAIQALGFGRFEKVALRFEEAFWLAQGRINFLHLSASTPMEFPVFLDLTPYVGEPALVALCSDGFAGSLAARGDAEIEARVLEILAQLFGPIPPPSAVAVSRWGPDPWTRGAYSYVALGSTPADFDALAEPVGGRLLFAGEATNAARFGYADGALDTGLREARRLLGTATVCVPEPERLALAAAAGGALLWLARRLPRSSPAWQGCADPSGG